MEVSDFVANKMKKSNTCWQNFTDLHAFVLSPCSMFCADHCRITCMYVHVGIQLKHMVTDIIQCTVYILYNDSNSPSFFQVCPSFSETHFTLIMIITASVDETPSHQGSLKFL